MADERLTDKSELTTVADGDKVHIVDVSDTSQNAAGSSKWITKANLVGTPFAGAFTDLSDVDETTLVGQDGRVPQVRGGKLELNRLPTYQDLLGGNAIISGGVTYITGALSYYAFGESYIINNELIETYVSGFTTLSTGDATNPRIDVITITMSGATPSIVVVEGTPAASPVKPAINLRTQVELSFISVAALATTDPNVITEVVYDENLGENAEWDITNTPAGANLADNTDPAVGTVSITLPAYTSDIIEWTKDALYTYVTDETLSFYMRIASGITRDSKIDFKLRDSSTGYYYNFSSTIDNMQSNGFVGTVTAWQLVQIPLSAFSANSFVQTQFDELELTFTDTPAIELDWFVFQGGVENPSNQGIGKFKNGDDPLDAVYTEGNVGIKTTTPTQALDVAGNININEASAYLQDDVQALKLAKNGEALYYSTHVGLDAGSTDSGSTFQTAIGKSAGGLNTGISQTAAGVGAGYQNTGDTQTATGQGAGEENTGDFVTQTGFKAGYQNTQNFQTVTGREAGYQNTGTAQTTNGYYSGRQNTGNSQTAHGYFAGYQNTGTNQTAMGSSAGFLNIGDNLTFFGNNAGGNTAVNTGAVKSFDGTDVNNTTEDITITAHSFGTIGTYVNALFTEGTAAIGGLIDGATYQFYIRDANTISGLQGTRQTVDTTNQLGTGHTFTPQYIYDNATGVGYNAQVTRNNQVKLGDANVTEMMLDGIGAGIVLKSPDGTEYKLTVANGGTLVIT